VSPEDVSLLRQLGVFGPGFLLAAFIYLQSRRENERRDASADDRAKRHEEALLVLNREVRDTLNANTKAFGELAASNAILAEAIRAAAARRGERE
jgi:hypothetical protein